MLRAAMANAMSVLPFRRTVIDVVMALVTPEQARYRQKVRASYYEQERVKARHHGRANAVWKNRGGQQNMVEQ